MSGHDLSNWPLFRSLLDDGASETRKPAKCFVAGPFDAADANTRDHALSVWKYVVRPALLDTERAPRRVEVLDSEEHIAKATVDALLVDQVGIVIASGRSFSVDYALNVNQAMKRPLIFLIEEGQSVPAHGAADRVVTYSFRPDALIGQANIRALQAALAHIDTALAAGASQPAEIASAPVVNAVSASARAPRPFSDDDRAALLRAASKRIDIMGIANLPLAVRTDVMDFACSDAARGIEIRVLQCAPGNPGLPTVVGARDMQQLAQVQGEIEAAAEAWRRLANAPACKAFVTLRRAQTAVPLSSAVITDQGMAAAPYLFSRAAADGPSFVADPGSAEYVALAAEFEALWGDGATVFRRDVQVVPGARSAPVLDQPPFSASFSPVQRIAPAPPASAQPAAAQPAAAQPALSQAAATASAPVAASEAEASTETAARTGSAVIPPSTSGLLKGFSSLRGVSSN